MPFLSSSSISKVMKNLLAFAAASIILLNNGISRGATYDSLASELKDPSWELKLLRPAYIASLNEREDAFAALVELVGNIAIDWRVRIKGIRLLGETGNIRAADVLMKLYYDAFSHSECPALKSNLVLALGHFHDDSRVIATIIEAMNDSEVQVREAAVLAAEELGSPDLLPHIIDKLKDSSAAVKLNSIRAIVRHGDARLVSYLAEIIAEERDPFLKTEALRLLNLVEERQRTAGVNPSPKL